jgi:hypothetical protein
MKHVLSIFFASLILLSNAGVTVATHYCGGQAVLASVTMNQLVLDCGMQPSESRDCTPSTSVTIERSNCCENHYTQLTIEDDFFGPSVEKMNKATFLIALPFCSDRLSALQADRLEKHQIYSPPKLAMDIPILVQSFLI